MWFLYSWEYRLYRVIKKSLCTWWLQYRKLQVMFKVSPANLQTFTDTPNCVLEDRVQYSKVHIPNVFCDGHLKIINCVEIIRIHWVYHRTPEKKSGGEIRRSWRPNYFRNSWFQTFAVFCMLYVFFLVIPRRLNLICQRFGTLYVFHLHRQEDK
jgi:hypothetical protein